jgi:undecaprenyl-diphosphatase
MLPITGVVLLLGSLHQPGTQNYQQLSYGRGLLIGISQAVAILPGLSRSGLTITSGMSLGLAPQSAATFSFLLAIPAIGGAGLLEIMDLMKESPGTTPIADLAIAAAVSFAVGLLALWWLVRWLEKGRLQYFAYWCIPAGLAVLVWQVFAR